MQSVNQQVRPPESGDRRHAAWVAAIAAVAIVVALLKPWGAPPAARPAAETAPVLDSPSPTPVARSSSNETELAAFCLDPAGWRVYSTQTWGGRDVRSWIAVQPVASATGPRDSSIPVIPVVGTIVRSLGWCAPVSGPERPPPTAWATVYGVVRDVQAGRQLVAEFVPPRLRPGTESAMGAEYGPPGVRSRGELPDGWPSGLYVFRVADADETYVRWFAAQVQVLPRDGG